MQIITPHTLPDDYVLVDYLHVDCTHRNTCDHESVAQLPENLKKSLVHCTWGQESSLFRPDDFTATSIQSYLAEDRPPLLLYITTFQDGTILSLIWPHVLFDGAGLAAFLGAWSLVVNGKISQVPPHSARPDAQGPGRGGNGQGQRSTTKVSGSQTRLDRAVDALAHVDEAEK